MPNHTKNYCRVIGTPAQIDALITGATTILDDGSRTLEFNSILPCPPELRDTASPTDIVETDTEAVAKNVEWRGRMGSQNRAITLAEADRRRAEYNALNWYDWCIANWDTKWPAYNATHYSHHTDIAGAWIDLVFNTAWSAPHKIFAALEAQYGVKVHARSIDEGGLPDAVFGDPDEHMYCERTVTFD